MKIETPEYTIYNDDCIKVMHDSIPDDSIDLTICSIPFGSLYAYSGYPGDMGNSKESDEEFKLHFHYYAAQQARIMKPGRNVNIHVADVPRLKEHHGHIGVYDLRGDVIRIFEEYGLRLYRMHTINKNPQVQSIRTHSITLSFDQWDKDSSVSGGGLADYLLIFKKEGDNQVPVKARATRDDWIKWAAPCWDFVRETITLSVVGSKDLRDEKHVCPLQLDVIEPVIRWQCNPGETVFSPFMGIGSEGFMALKWKNKFIGCELKESYFTVAHKNMELALRQRDQQMGLNLV